MNLYINCSPKIKNSNSAYFIDLIKNDDDDILYLYKDKINIKDLKKYNNIIIAFPLYIDTFPYKLSEFFEKYNNFYNKNIYVICNLGFLEVEQSKLAIQNIEYIINLKKGRFMGYLNIATGEIIGITKRKKVLKLFCFDFKRKIRILKKCINKRKKIYLNTNIKLLNKKLFCLVSNHYFKKRLK